MKNQRFRLKDCVKVLLLIFAVRPFVWFFMGLNRYSRLKIPHEGAYILAPNHNSHLDTVLLYGLLPIPVALRACFAAAADYFFFIPGLNWFLFDVLEMVPIWRKGFGGDPSKPFPDPLESMARVLDQGKILVLFPEGTRGEPEKRASLKTGVARIALEHPDVPIYPIHMRGLGKSLPRGDFIFIPLIPQVVLGEPIYARGKTLEELMTELNQAFEELESRVSRKDWMPA